MLAYVAKMQGSKLSLPFVKFNGVIQLHSSEDEINAACDQIRAASAEAPIHVGFDCEWDVVTYPVHRQSKVAVIQICLNDSLCHVFHLTALNYCMTTKLKDLICSPNLIKVGVNVSGDIYKLHKDYGIKSDFIVTGTQKSILELGELANSVYGSKGSWSLDSLTQHVLKQRLNKDQSLRMSRWSQIPLEKEQILYAVNDAYVSLLLREKLEEQKLRIK